MFFVGKIDDEKVKACHEAVRSIDKRMYKGRGKVVYYTVDSYHGQFIFDTEEEAQEFDKGEKEAIRLAYEFAEPLMKERYSDEYDILGGWHEDHVYRIMNSDLTDNSKRFALGMWTGLDFYKKKSERKDTIKRLSYAKY